MVDSTAARPARAEHGPNTACWERRLTWRSLLAFGLKARHEPDNAHNGRKLTWRFLRSRRMRASRPSKMGRGVSVLCALPVAHGLRQQRGEQVVRTDSWRSKALECVAMPPESKSLLNLSSLPAHTRSRCRRADRPWPAGQGAARRKAADRARERVGCSKLTCKS